MGFGAIENYCKLSDETKKVIAEETRKLEATDRENKSISYFKCCKKHVFICPDFSMIMKLGIVETIHGDHNIHIFISADYESLHDGSFNKFMEQCFSRTNNIFIHIPMSSRNIRPIIESAIPENIPYKVFIDRDGKPRIFFYNEMFDMRVDKKTDKWSYELVRKYLVLSSMAYFNRYNYQFIEILGGANINDTSWQV